MGGSRWSDDHYSARATARKTAGVSAFAYHDTVSKSTDPAAKKAHDTLNPLGVKVRESRDSDTHPDSLAIAVLFDVTGSMGDVPRILQANLPKLMALLIKKGYVQHPQILIGGIGDATCDKVPLQIGQFESGIEIDEDLGKLYLEAGGGGQNTESYELALYFMARHTAIDCQEKRGRRGYLFVIGDETAYSRVSASQVKTLIGDSIGEDIPLADIVKEVEKKYDSYFIIPNMTSHYAEEWLHKHWVKAFGQNVLRLEQPDGICELIASTIGLGEGAIDLDGVANHLREEGTDEKTVGAVSRALATVGAGKNELSAVSLPDVGGESGSEAI